MKLTHIFCIALLSLSFYSCSQTQAETATIDPNSITNTHEIAPQTAFIDTTFDEVNLFVNSVDDMNGLAYGRIYQTNEAEVTEFLVTVPYNCIRYDANLKGHMLLTRKFNRILNTDSTTSASIEIASRDLVGFDND